MSSAALTVAAGAVTVVAQFLNDLCEAKVDNLQSTHISHRIMTKLRASMTHHTRTR